MAKHLPPSASRLRLLDVNGAAGATLRELRDDLEVVAVPGHVAAWEAAAPASVDAVVAYDYVLNAPFLTESLVALRPGGRLIVVNTRGTVAESLGRRLEAHGYVRILVEQVGEGVLIRGEKPHTTADTLTRIRQVAGQDADALDLAHYRGRYVHLLVQETPNIPVWRRDGSEVIAWHAAALAGDPPILLAFSSLPKAVGLMQAAVLEGRIKDINKVGKFSKETAATWPQDVLLNPTLSMLRDVILIPVDPSTAEAPDE